MKKAFIIIAGLLALGEAKAQVQDDFPVNQYMFNNFFINPAAAGIKKYGNATLLTRSQLTNIEGAPQSSYFTFDMPLNKDKVGLGITVANDKIGVTNQTSAFLAYSYHFHITENTMVSLGLRGGFSNYLADLNNVTKWDFNDPALEQNVNKNTNAKFGGGMFVYNNNFYAGLSVPQLVDYNLSSTFGKSNELNTRKTFNITAGYIYEVNDELSLKPSILFKRVEEVGTITDYTMNFLLHKIVWLGGTYQSNGGIGANVLLQAGHYLRIGYGYNYSLSSYARLTSSVHELMIGIDLGYDRAKMRNPRYF